MKKEMNYKEVWLCRFCKNDGITGEMIVLGVKPENKCCFKNSDGYCFRDKNICDIIKFEPNEKVGLKYEKQ